MSKKGSQNIQTLPRKVIPQASNNQQIEKQIKDVEKTIKNWGEDVPTTLEGWERLLKMTNEEIASGWWATNDQALKELRSIKDYAQGEIEDLRAIEMGIIKGERKYTSDYLESLPTLCQGQADDLKIEEPGFRVWISRCGVEDGEPYDNKITIEEYIDGNWIVTDEYPG